MHFEMRLNPTFEQRNIMLLAQTRISSLDEAIAAIMQEESCIHMLKELWGCGQH
jgi:hypothetical protein